MESSPFDVVGRGGGAGLTMIGLIHSPFADGRLYLPSALLPDSVFTISAGYLLMGIAYFIMSAFNRHENIQ